MEKMANTVGIERYALEEILSQRYGETSMVTALSNYLYKRLQARDWGSRGREYMIMTVCWQWFPGGDTASSAAADVEKRLGGHEHI